MPRRRCPYPPERCPSRSKARPACRAADRWDAPAEAASRACPVRRTLGQGKRHFRPIDAEPDRSLERCLRTRAIAAFESRFAHEDVSREHSRIDLESIVELDNRTLDVVALHSRERIVV